MVSILIALSIVLSIVIILQAIKIHYLRKTAREITENFAERLVSDTNTLIDISSQDKYMRQLSIAINTQLRLLRKQRRQYLKGDRELKEAVTNIAHDLRTPLTAICGYLELLEKEEKSENVARYVSYIKDRSNALTVLSEELFRYSVVISTKEELTCDNVCINSVLEKSIASFYYTLTKRNIEPNINITEKHIVRHLNQDALSRVFGNIINNALKYSDGDLDISLSDDGKIIFSNTATSLDEIHVGKLFDRFYTVETARKSTGLGLAISKTLVEQMNGNITAKFIDKKLSIIIDFRK